jgi:sulfhydrogenase subunit beta (sulfur reductase)
MDKPSVINKENLNKLIAELNQQGYKTIGPTIRGEAIVYDHISSTEDLPEGWTDEQGPGHYRIKKRNDKALFGFNVSPHSWKQFLHPPEKKLWIAEKNGSSFKIIPEELKNPKFAFIGVRSCELHAIAIQDKVFIQGPHIDSVYQINRKDLFTVAVNCGQAGGTCFCVSMQTGPKVNSEFDLALTEILEKDKHYFVVETGSDRAQSIIKNLDMRPAENQELKVAEKIIDNTAQNMGRFLDTEGIKETLFENLEHPRWEEVANRCLSCANCTMACPTCFCSTVEDVTDITGDHAERWQKWDSCFTMDFTYIHGGHARHSTKSQYRQWMTHKLASWIDQFDSSGCVGCGRCITWCPVGIDLTEEVAAIRNSDKTKTDNT